MEVWRGTQEGLDAVIVNPGVILGSGHWNSASGSILKNISRGIPFFTAGGVGIVDVVDVVEVMLALMESPIKNRNYILVSTNISYCDFLTKLAGYLNKKPPKRSISRWKLELLSNLDWLSHKLLNTKRKLFKPTIRSLYSTSIYDASKIENDLGFSFQPYEKTMERVAANFLMKY